MKTRTHQFVVAGAGFLVGTLATVQFAVGASALTGLVTTWAEAGSSRVGTLSQPTASTSSATTTASATSGIVLVDVATQSGEGAGTGMVIDPSGLVLTNYHVVEGSVQIRVTVADTGEAYTATVVGHDATRDVALLQLQGASGLATVRLDTFDPVDAGDTVTAIGNGGGTGALQTVTGTVAATDQDIQVADEATPWGSEALTGLIESDAAIIPGYSGGPLFDADGEVVGINTAGSTSARVVDAYAIPIGTAMAVVDVIESGTSQGTTHVGPAAALGISVYPTQRATRRQVGSASARGVLVAGVSAGSAAETAGLTAGATITSVDGTATGSTAALSEVLAQHAPGDVVAVAWVDVDGTAVTADVTLQASPVN